MDGRKQYKLLACMLGAGKGCKFKQQASLKLETCGVEKEPIIIVF